MRPILFKRNETEFKTNGIGRLTDALSCTVEESRNGVYELEMVYPIDGVHFADIALESFIYARHSDATDMQAFRIYRISKPLNGRVTINARHISYDLSKIVVSPFTADTINEAMQDFPLYALNDCPFTFSTDKTTTGTFTVAVPSSIRSVLGGVQGSILDVYGGGEYEWNMYSVQLHSARGSASGVTIRYGKNLTDMEHTHDSEDQYSGIAPFWANETDRVVLPEGVIYSENAAAYYDTYNDQRNAIYTDQNGNEYGGYLYEERIVPLDLTDKFETAPTVEQLRAAAQSFLNSTDNTGPAENIKVNFVQLWQTEEYKDYAPLQRVKLCDIVDVIYTKLGVKVSAKVIRTVYNVLLERYDEMELGDPKKTLASTLASQTADINNIRKIAESSSVSMSDVAAAIRSNSEKITGALGGYVVIDSNTSTGYPERILVMDSASTSTAQNVIQINNAGIGFSQNGINGPYETAWTIDGSFTANFISTWSLSASQITSGTMSANLIKGGALKIGGTASGAGGNGSIALYNSNNVNVGAWNVNGLTIGTGGEFIVDMTGKLVASGAEISGKITGRSGSIGGINIDSDYGLYTGSKTSATSTANGFLISNSGAIYLGAYNSTTGACPFQVTSAGNLTAVTGKIAGFVFGLTSGGDPYFRKQSPITAGTANQTQYEVSLYAPESPSPDDNGFTVRYRSYDGSSYGSWVYAFTAKYNGMVSSISEAESSIYKRITIHHGRLKYYRGTTASASTWIGEWAVGTYAESGYTTRNAIFLGAHQNNVLGFGIQSSTETTATPTFIYNPNHDAFFFLRDVSFNGSNSITNIKQVQIQGYGYAVHGLNTSHYYQCHQSSTTALYFYVDGSAFGYISANSSDERFKKFIKPVDEDLADRIGKVELKQFRFRGDRDDGKTHYGAIAQEVKEALGEEDPTSLILIPPKEDGTDGEYMNLNYMEFLILRMAALEKRVRALEGEK